MCGQEISTSRLQAAPLHSSASKCRQGSARETGVAGQLVGHSRLPLPQRTTEQETRVLLTSVNAITPRTPKASLVNFTSTILFQVRAGI